MGGWRGSRVRRVCRHDRAPSGRHTVIVIDPLQVCGGFPDSLARCAQMLDEHIDVDFVDVNMGCPIDIVTNRSAG